MKKKFKDILRYLFPPQLEKKTISAIHEDDLIALLDKFGLTEKINNKEMNCYFCNDIITIEGVESIFSYEGEIQLCCNKVFCYTETLELIGAQNGA